MSQAQSPFKFLDSYQQPDAEVFFGREKETTDLYSALSGVKHLLVYGPSGSGKTSLVECGLRNRFSDADWFALTIRKGANINASVFAGINNELGKKIDIDPISKMPVDAGIEFGEAVEKLFKERFQPVYLLFDQFEELLISGSTEEKTKFFTALNKLIHNKVPCRIMLIMREEFIGHLSEFESLCPSIFQHRFRVEKMGRKNVEEVIFHILEAPKYRSFFNVEDSQQLAESILSKLPDKRKEIELAHVQVFLGELWDRAQINKQNDQLPLLSAKLINEEDDLEGILESFLKKQMRALDEVYGESVSLELLAAMISEKFTKLQVSEQYLLKDLEHKKVHIKTPIANLLNELERRRIVRTINAGDETQYEISHDVLALVVGQNLTEEMKIREKAADIYKVYGERQGLFSQDDIDYLRPFQKSLSYPEELQTRVEKSMRAIKRERRKKIAAVFLILLVIIAFLIAYSVKSRLTEIKALNDKATAEAAEQKTKELLKIVLKGRGEQYINQDVNETIERLNIEQTYPIDSLIVPRATSVPVSGSNNFDFLIWIDLPSFRAAEIKEVEYKWPCKGFVDSIHIGSKPSLGFAFGYRGWGYCPVILIKVVLKNGAIVPIRFELGKYLENESAY